MSSSSSSTLVLYLPLLPFSYAEQATQSSIPSLLFDYFCLIFLRSTDLLHDRHCTLKIRLVRKHEVVWPAIAAVISSQHHRTLALDSDAYYSNILSRAGSGASWVRRARIGGVAAAHGRSRSTTSTMSDLHGRALQYHDATPAAHCILDMQKRPKRSLPRSGRCTPAYIKHTVQSLDIDVNDGKTHGQERGRRNVWWEPCRLFGHL